MDKLKPWLPWIFRAVGLALVIALAVAWNNARTAQSELRRETERLKLEKAKLEVALRGTKADMAEMEQKYLMESAYLTNEVARLKDELGKKPKVKIIVKWVTVPSQIVGSPLFIPCPGGEKVECHLPPGATGHVEGVGLAYKTEAGNHVLVGEASCWRDTPEPKAMLFKSGLNVDVTQLYVEQGAAAQGDSPGWGVGLRGEVGSAGWAAGPVLAFPPLSFLFKTQVEMALDFTVGTPWPAYLANPNSNVPPVLLQGGLSVILRGR